MAIGVRVMYRLVRSVYRADRPKYVKTLNIFSLDMRTSKLQNSYLNYEMIIELVHLSCKAPAIKPGSYEIRQPPAKTIQPCEDHRPASEPRSQLGGCCGWA